MGDSLPSGSLDGTHLQQSHTVFLPLPAQYLVPGHQAMQNHQTMLNCRWDALILRPYSFMPRDGCKRSVVSWAVRSSQPILNLFGPARDQAVEPSWEIGHEHAITNRSPVHARCRIDGDAGKPSGACGAARRILRRASGAAAPVHLSPDHQIPRSCLPVGCMRPSHRRDAPLSLRLSLPGPPWCCMEWQSDSPLKKRHERVTAAKLATFGGTPDGGIHVAKLRSTHQPDARCRRGVGAER